MTNFVKRVFGCVVVKAINSNYNADFSGQPRTLPSGTVYATDKAFKYSCKNYIKIVYPEERVFYFKSLNTSMNPISLNECYQKFFGKFPDKGNNKDNTVKKEVAKNLLSCIDVRLFGATFAGETNISLHGPVQINHGVNIWSENNIYSEQITSPFSNKADDPDAEKGMTSIGRQSKLEEGHYLHHFSVNPQNLSDIVALVDEGAQSLNIEDIDKLKEAMRRGVTWYDSASKVGCENEMLIWIQLKEGSKAVLPSLAGLVELLPQKEDRKYVYDLSKLSSKLDKMQNEIEKVEIYYEKESLLLKNAPQQTQEIDL